jgi:hypothetical protein
MKFWRIATVVLLLATFYLGASAGSMSVSHVRERAALTDEIFALKRSLFLLAHLAEYATMGISRTELSDALRQFAKPDDIVTSSAGITVHRIVFSFDDAGNLTGITPDVPVRTDSEL